MAARSPCVDSGEQNANAFDSVARAAIATESAFRASSGHWAKAPSGRLSVMTEAEERDSMERAWLDAAAQLEIRVTVPYIIPSDLGPARFTAYLPDFGGSNGMVVGPVEQDSDKGDTRRLAAGEAGLYFSLLADQYRSFDWDLFVDTLNDWGWFGADDAKPDWYTGEAWG